MRTAIFILPFEYKLKLTIPARQAYFKPLYLLALKPTTKLPIKTLS